MSVGVPYTVFVGGAAGIALQETGQGAVAGEATELGDVIVGERGVGEQVLDVQQAPLAEQLDERGAGEEQDGVAEGATAHAQEIGQLLAVHAGGALEVVGDGLQGASPTLPRGREVGGLITGVGVEFFYGGEGHGEKVKS